MPQEHQHAEQQAREKDLRPRARPHAHHRAEASHPSFLDRSALLVEANGQEGRDNHEPRQRRVEDIVAPERDEGPDEQNR